MAKLGSVVLTMLSACFPIVASEIFRFETSIKMDPKKSGVIAVNFQTFVNKEKIQLTKLNSDIIIGYETVSILKY